MTRDELREQVAAITADWFPSASPHYRRGFLDAVLPAVDAWLEARR